MSSAVSSAFRPIAALLVAAVSVGGCGDAPSGPGQRPPVASFTIEGGNDQISAAGEPLPIAPQVRVGDAAGGGIAGMRVNFAITAGGGQLLTPAVVTDTNGFAEALWELGTSVGAQRLVAAVADVEAGASFGLEFSAVAVAGTPTRFEILAGDDQVGGAGHELAQPLVVRARDRYDNPVNGAEVLWTVTAGGGSLSMTSRA